MVLFGGKSALHSGFHTESPGLFCRGDFIQNSAKPIDASRSDEEPAHFHTLKRVNDFPVYFMVEKWSLINDKMLELCNFRVTHLA